MKYVRHGGQNCGQIMHNIDGNYIRQGDQNCR